MSQPSGPIQQLAPGFLSVLNLKNKGLLPDVLNGVVQPTYDLEDYFLRGAAELGSNAVVLGAGSPSGFTSAGLGIVDQNEVWWVEYYTLQTTPLTAGDVMNLTPGFQIQVGAAQVFFAVGDRVSQTGTPRVLSASRDFWLPPGAELGFMIDATIAAGEGVTCSSRFAQLRV